MLSITKYSLFIRYLLLTFITFFITILVVSLLSFKAEIKQQLQQKLAPELTQAFKQHMFDVEYKSVVINNINQQLAVMDNTSSLSFISNYSFTAQALFLTNYNDSFFYNPLAHQLTNLSTVYTHWSFGLEPKTAKLTVNYTINWLLLITISTGMAFITTLFLLALPKPESIHAKYWLHTLKTLKIEHNKAKKLSQQLEGINADQHNWLTTLLNAFINKPHLLQQVNIEDLVLWLVENNYIKKQNLERENNNIKALSHEKFITALTQPAINFEQAYQLAKEPSTLSFNMKRFTINANGVEIKLAKTPFFYYVWYAYLRVNEPQSGWLINPSITHPDLQSAKSILTLMKDNHGHNKSINELENHGLRAKTLDQNRNKIKESFIAPLGETLSEPYLFEFLRDTRTGRFKYRLKLGSAHIFLPKPLINNNLSTVNKIENN